MPSPVHRESLLPGSAAFSCPVSEPGRGFLCLRGNRAPLRSDWMRSSNQVPTGRIVSELFIGHTIYTGLDKYRLPSDLQLHVNIAQSSLARFRGSTYLRAVYSGR